MAWRSGGEGEGPKEPDEAPASAGGGSEEPASDSPFGTSFSVRKVPIPEEPGSESWSAPVSKGLGEEPPVTEDPFVPDDPDPFQPPPLGKTSRRPAFARRTQRPDQPTEVLAPPLGPTDDPLAPFLLPVDSPRVTHRTGIAKFIDSGPAWQKALLAGALLILVVVLGVVLFGGDDPEQPITPVPTTPAATIAPTTPPATAPALVPGLVDKNCSDFTTQVEAQNFYKESGGPEKDLHGIDPDKNGNACDDPSSQLGSAPAPSAAATRPAPAAKTLAPSGASAPATSTGTTAPATKKPGL